MKKLFTLTLVFATLFIGVNAQQKDLEKERTETRLNPMNAEVQKESTASIQELLTRRDNIGKQLGPVSAHFSIEEQRMLKSYFSNPQSARPPNTASTIISNSSAEGEAGQLTTIYGIDNPSKELIGFDPASPENTEVFGNSPITVNFEDAGAIDPNNPTTGYVIDDWGEFYSFDVETGFYTYLGSMYGWWLDMEYDRTTGILYA